LNEKGDIVQPACEPSYLILSEGPTIARPDPAVELGAKLALIGCSNNLSKIRAAQRKEIEEHLRRILVKENFSIERDSQSLSFRRSFAIR
jgi:hypothetical protein